MDSAVICISFKKHNIMKSPITGKEMKLMKERRSMVFRNKTFEIDFHFYKCEDSGEQFTTTELDEMNTNQIYKHFDI